MCGKDLTSVYGVTINLVVLIVLLTAIYKSEMVSMWLGFIIGLCAYAGVGSLLGWYVVTLALIGLTAYNIKQKLNLDSLYAKLLMIGGGVFIHNLFLLIISGADNFFIHLLTKVIPGALYSSIIAWLFFMIKDGRLTYKKFKELF